MCGAQLLFWLAGTIVTGDDGSDAVITLTAHERLHRRNPEAGRHGHSCGGCDEQRNSRNTLLPYYMYILRPSYCNSKTTVSKTKRTRMIPSNPSSAERQLFSAAAEDLEVRSQVESNIHGIIVHSSDQNNRRPHD